MSYDYVDRWNEATGDEAHKRLLSIANHNFEYVDYDLDTIYISDDPSEDPTAYDFEDIATSPHTAYYIGRYHKGIGCVNSHEVLHAMGKLMGALEFWEDSSDDVKEMYVRNALEVLDEAHDYNVDEDLLD